MFFATTEYRNAKVGRWFLRALLIEGIIIVVKKSAEAGLLLLLKSRFMRWIVSCRR